MLFMCFFHCCLLMVAMTTTDVVDRPPTSPCAGWRHHRVTSTSAVIRRCGTFPSGLNRCSSHVTWRHNYVSCVPRGRQGRAGVTSSCRGPIATRCWISTWLEASTREAESSLLSWNPTPSRTLPVFDAAIRSLLYNWSLLNKCLGEDTKAAAHRSPNYIGRKYRRSMECQYLSYCRNSVKNCFCKQNFTKISQSAAELWPKYDFWNGGRSPSWILLVQ